MKKIFNVIDILSVICCLAVFSQSCSSNQPETEENQPAESKDELVIKEGEILDLNTTEEFKQVIDQIESEKKALFVFDVDNTLLITNDNKFGSDWWYAQTKENPALKLNVDNACLFDVLTPLFYSVFDTKPVFPNQPSELNSLKDPSNKTIACTSRGYSDVVGASTVLELSENEFDFMQGDTMTLSNGVVMRNDIIYTKGKNKGIALLEYLDRNPYDHVYYFDDSFFKVENVQNAFAEAGVGVHLFYMKIAPKVPYTESEIQYMQEKLLLMVEQINKVGVSRCKCDD